MYENDFLSSSEHCKQNCSSNRQHEGHPQFNSMEGVKRGDAYRSARVTRVRGYILRILPCNSPKCDTGETPRVTYIRYVWLQVLVARPYDNWKRFPEGIIAVTEFAQNKPRPLVAMIGRTYWGRYDLKEKR